MLLEPRESDANFFAMNPLSFWKRSEAGQHGFESVRETIEQNYEQLQAVFERNGLAMDRNVARRRASRARAELGWAPAERPQSEPDDRRLRLVGT